MHAREGLVCSKVPEWEEVSYMWAKVPEKERVELYANIKALAYAPVWSAGECVSERLSE
jgi:hypothetical protein